MFYLLIPNNVLEHNLVMADSELSSVSVSPLKGTRDKSYDGPLFLKHWFEELAVPDSKGKTHQCRRCDSKVTFRGKSAGHNVFVKHVSSHKKWRDDMERALSSSVAGGLTNFYPITKKIQPKLRNVYGWLDLIIFGLAISPSTYRRIS